MKKRMTALVTALLVTMLCLPFYLFSTGTVVNAFYYKNDDLGRFGPNEEYVIVPMNARNSALTFDTPAEGSKSTTFSLKTKDEYYTNQIWVVRKVGDYYAFECKGTGMVVDIPGGNAVKNTALQVHEYNETDALYWRLEAMEDGSYIIHSKLNDNLCWDMKGASNADGTETMLHPRHANPNQRFRFVCVSTSEQTTQTEHDDLERYGLDEEYTIVPLHAGNSAVDLSSNGKDIHLWKAHHRDNQRWKLKKVGDYYAFVSSSGGKVIDVPGADASSGKALQGYEYNGTDAQLFWLESMGDGTYMIHSKRNDSFVWNIRGASWNDGSALQLYSVTKDPNERFRFVHVSTVEPMSDWGSTRQDCNGSNWSVWDGTKNTGWYDSSTTDLYINSAADLGGLSLLVESGHDMLKKTIHLNCDINLAGIQWTPIGFGEKWFRGSFNGHNHAIIGLQHQSGEDNIGLFGRVNGGTICNLAVKGTIKGDYQVGGICGEGRPIKCLNMGVVTGHEEVGAIAGNATGDTPYCYALAYSAASLYGKGDSRADWVTASEILSGKICYRMSVDPVTGDWFYPPDPLSQNIGSDPYPTFGSAKVVENGDSYSNGGYQVKVETDRGYGTVSGAGEYSVGNTVTLKASPAPGCVFDHFEVKTADETRWTGFNGESYYYPTGDILPPPTLTLRGGGFSLKYSSLYSINELSPCRSHGYDRFVCRTDFALFILDWLRVIEVYLSESLIIEE